MTVVLPPPAPHVDHQQLNLMVPGPPANLGSRPARAGRPADDLPLGLALLPGGPTGDGAHAVRPPMTSEVQPRFNERVQPNSKK
ncbi:MAG TPA: hypothetical protein VFG47_19830 [Geminicoccaceae bacterium]|nr:hypothetical protein [Geminicoccaceae bacterium]